MKYESEKNIVEDINNLALKLIEAYKKAITIREKYSVLQDGILKDDKVIKKWYEFWK